MGDGACREEWEPVRAVVDLEYHAREVRLLRRAKGASVE